MSTATAQVDEHFPAETPPPDKDKMHVAVRCLVITPEATVLDEPAAFVALPLYDGELGVSPGRAPLIGRLGFGELRIRGASATRRYFIDGGFVQVRDDIVTVVTARASASDQIDAEAARAELEAAKAHRATTDAEMAEKQKALSRARAQLRIASRGGPAS